MIALKKNKAVTVFHGSKAKLSAFLDKRKIYPTEAAGIYIFNNGVTQAYTGGWSRQTSQGTITMGSTLYFSVNSSFGAEKRECIFYMSDSIDVTNYKYCTITGTFKLYVGLGRNTEISCGMSSDGLSHPTTILTSAMGGNTNSNTSRTETKSVDIDISALTGAHRLGIYISSKDNINNNTDEECYAHITSIRLHN